MRWANNKRQTNLEKKTDRLSLNAKEAKGVLDHSLWDGAHAQRNDHLRLIDEFFSIDFFLSNSE